jgi:hypothetical protein
VSGRGRSLASGQVRGRAVDSRQTAESSALGQSPNARPVAFRRASSSTSTDAWTVEASSHFEAMTKYYEYQGWGTYTTVYPAEDKQTYAERGWE